tara:strand:- start:355 stop:603 length:249 start_codon:yes stop_codon:yes gene_type:complete
MSVEQVIALVEKWIADPESVSQEELKAAYADARDAAAAAASFYAYGAAYVAAAAAAAIYAALNGDIDEAKFWVAEYHESIND